MNLDPIIRHRFQCSPHIVLFVYAEYPGGLFVHVLALDFEEQRIIEVKRMLTDTESLERAFESTLI